MTLDCHSEYPADRPSGCVMPSDVAVVVCAYTEGRWDALLNAIRSIEAQACAPMETVVVIDHNEILLRRARAELGSSSVRIVENTGHPGLGGARNTGVSETRSEVVAFLDDDAEARPDWLERICAAYVDARVLGVGGRIDAVWSDERPRWFPAEFDWVVGCTYEGLPEQPAPVRNLIGCNMSFRRVVFTQLGGFNLGYGCDETEFCLRIGERWPAGRLVYTPAAAVLHHISADRQTFRYFRKRCYFEGGSKAVVTWLHSPIVGLSSERTYVLKTLPRGFVSNLRDATLRRRFAAFGRSAAIAAGLVFAASGYVAGKASINGAATRRGYAPDPAQAPAPARAATHAGPDFDP